MEKKTTERKYEKYFKNMSFREENGKQLLLTLQNIGKNKRSHQVGRLKQMKGATFSQHIIKLWMPSYYRKLRMPKMYRGSKMNRQTNGSKSH